VFDKTKPRWVGAPNKAHRPIRSEHQSIRAEGFKGGFEVGVQEFGAPRLGADLGNESRELAANAFALCERSQSLQPFGSRGAVDLWFGDVVHDETHAGMSVDQLESGRQLPGIDQQIIGEAALRDFSQAGIEPGCRHEGIGLSLENVTHAPEPRARFPHSVEEGRSGLRVGQGDPSHDSPDRWMRRRELKEPSRFGQRLAGLDRDAAGDPGERLFGSKVVGEKIPTYLGHIVADPTELVGRIAPEVLMRVDNLRHFARVEGTTVQIDQHFGGRSPKRG